VTNVSNNFYSIVLPLMVIIRTLYYRAKKINTYGERSKMKYLELDRSSSIQGAIVYWYLVWDCLNHELNNKFEFCVQFGQKYIDETAKLDPPHSFVPWVVVNNEPIGKVCLFSLFFSFIITHTIGLVSKLLRKYSSRLLFVMLISGLWKFYILCLQGL